MAAISLLHNQASRLMAPLTAALLALTLGCGEGSVTTAPGNNGGPGDDGEGGDGGGTPSASVVADVQPAEYETDTLETAEQVYVDRDFTIEGVPPGFEGWEYVRTANDHKNDTSDAAVVLELADTATVALAYDERASQLPSWLDDWTATRDTLRTNDVDHPIFTRVFGPGEVALGGNLSGGAEGASSMYVLFADGADSAPDDGGDDGDGGDHGGDDGTVGAVEVSPASAQVDVGSTVQFSATVRDADGNELERDVAWSSSDASVATVDGDGTAAGQSEGSAQIIATSESVADSAVLDITAGDSPPPTPEGIPEPDSDDVIQFDMRAGGDHSIQSANNIDEASGNVIKKQRPFDLGFTTTFLGDGTRAFVLPIHHNAGNAEGCLGNGLPPNGSQQNAAIIPLASPSDDRLGEPGEVLYLQHKRYFGRSPDDQSPDAVGQVGAWRVHHKEAGEGPGGRKFIVWKRENNAIRRIDWIKFNRDPDIVHAESWMIAGLMQNTDDSNDPAADELRVGKGDESTELDPWWPDAHPGGPWTITLRIKLESSAGAGDGQVTVWINDTKYVERSGIGTGAAEFTNPEIGFPTWICPPQDQTEYLWDVVIWEER